MNKLKVIEIVDEADDIAHSLAIVPDETLIKFADLVDEVDSVLEDTRVESLSKSSFIVTTASLVSVDASAASPVAFSLASLLDVDHVKTRMVDVMPLDVPAGWLVMNAPRHLMGNVVLEGDFLTGRHYALIDPQDSMAAVFVKENTLLNARLVVEVSRDTQTELALHKNEYRDRYLEYPLSERFDMLSGLIDKFSDMPFGELTKAIVKTKGVVKE